MEFWGVEVKPGETVKVNPGDDKYLHLSQTSLGEVKKDKGSENVPVYVKFENQKLVLGTLSADKCAQIQFDLVFEKEFELSHSSKSTSVYFCGYKTAALEYNGYDEFSDGSESESDEDIPLEKNANGKPVTKDEQTKPTAGKPIALKADAKPKPKTEEPVRVDKQKVDENSDEDDEDDEDDEGDEDVSEGDESDEEMVEGEEESDDEDGSDDDDDDKEDEKTPSQPKPGKRALGSSAKTPVPEKKAKLVSPVGQKAGVAGNKGGYTATPHPAKQGGKTPANNDKSKQQTPKSAGSVSCKSCNKTFNSENALQSHTKAKHAGK